jgi:CRP/FNR family transcriptional regulator, dissimilatory nitrate respiration regulator
LAETAATFSLSTATRPQPGRSAEGENGSSRGNLSKWGQLGPNEVCAVFEAALSQPGDERATEARRYNEAQSQGKWMKSQEMYSLQQPRPVISPGMQNPAVDFRHSDLVAIFRDCALFEGVADSDLQAIAGITVVKCFAKGDYLFHEGSPVHGFYIVHTGAVKVHRVSLSGKEQVLHVYRANESFGEEALISDLGYAADASAVDNSRVLMVQRPEFLGILKREPELALCMLRSMSRQLFNLVELLDDLTLKDVKTRLANWLLHQCPDPESYEPYRIQLPMTKRVLAAELGTVSETFSRTVAKFRKQRLITVEGNTFTLLCPMKLSQFLGRKLKAHPSYAVGQLCSHAA